MKNFIILAAFSIVLTACKKEEEPIAGDCGFVVSYATDIRPIIESSCKTQAGPGTGCHDAWIDEYENIQTKLDAGAIQDRVFNQKNMPYMPNSFGIDSLTSDELEIMQCWIDQGYPEN
ncbi:MAG: hypothetical protein ABJG68_02005 [Crocinitomicaceae bacterium]